MSSKLLAASMIWGIPFLVPRSISMRAITEGTSTAGLTAAMQNPWAKARVHGQPKKTRVKMATVVASNI